MATDMRTSIPSIVLFALGVGSAVAFAAIKWIKSALQFALNRENNNGPFRDSRYSGGRMAYFLGLILIVFAQFASASFPASLTYSPPCNSSGLNSVDPAGFAWCSTQACVYTRELSNCNVSVAGRCPACYIFSSPQIYVCPSGSVLSGSSCACTSGYDQVSNACVAQCTGGKIRVNGVCTCPAGQTETNGQCSDGVCTLQ
jgi:hypothetical protein